MTKKTRFMLGVGAGSTGLATAMFLSVLIRAQWIPTMIGMMVGFAFVNFAFNRTKRALLLTATNIIVLGGLHYLMYVRRDMVGIGVALASFAIAYVIMRPHRYRNAA